jgi:small subunit ribosomal protein S16
VDAGQETGGKLPRITSLKIKKQVQEAERNWYIVVMIRLARFGAPKKPYYRIVVIEKDRARNGRSIEVVGTYNPRTNPATVDLKQERIAYWRSKGAQFSLRMAKIVAMPASSSVAADTSASSTPAAVTATEVAVPAAALAADPAVA